MSSIIFRILMSFDVLRVVSTLTQVGHGQYLHRLVEEVLELLSELVEQRCKDTFASAFADMHFEEHIFILRMVSDNNSKRIGQYKLLET